MLVGTEVGNSVPTGTKGHREGCLTSGSTEGPQYKSTRKEPPYAGRPTLMRAREEAERRKNDMRSKKRSSSRGHLRTDSVGIRSSARRGYSPGEGRLDRQGSPGDVVFSRTGSASRSVSPALAKRRDGGVSQSVYSIAVQREVLAAEPPVEELQKADGVLQLWDSCWRTKNIPNEWRC